MHFGTASSFAYDSNLAIMTLQTVSAGDSKQQMSEHSELLSAPFVTCLRWSLVLWKCLDQMANLLNCDQLVPISPLLSHALLA